MANPQFGLVAAALRAWLAAAQKADPDLTAAKVAKGLEVSAASFSEWINAGWLEGGSLPKALYRPAILKLAGGFVTAAMFEEDDRRRAERTRTKAKRRAARVASAAKAAA